MAKLNLAPDISVGMGIQYQYRTNLRVSCLLRHAHPAPHLDVAHLKCHASSIRLSRRRILDSFKAVFVHAVLSPFWPTNLKAYASGAVIQAETRTEEHITESRSPYDRPGPFQTAKLPRLEHICSRCFPLCVGDRCLIKIQVIYPRGAAETAQAPFPMAIISGGFLVKGDEYMSYAERLASWGYVTILYDKIENLIESLDDVASASVIEEIIDWATTDPLMQRISDTDNVYLIGHSRGGKISVLAAAGDPRIRSICLIDPVDNTVYAPVGPGYPSAVKALKTGSVHIPLLVIGSALGYVDCAPTDANFQKFYEAAQSDAAEVVIHDSGHFQFLDNPTAMERAICAVGTAEDVEVRRVAQSLMVAWGQTTVGYASGAVNGIADSGTASATASPVMFHTQRHPELLPSYTVRYKCITDILHGTTSVLCSKGGAENHPM